MTIHTNTNMETLVKQLLKDVYDRENFETPSIGKGSFLTGGSIIVCESSGLQEYIQKTAADVYGIWTALPFKPLAGFLMQCAYNLSEIKKDESENVFNQKNLVWAIYRLLEGEQKTFFFANELASLFMAYQIYRPLLIKNWNKGVPYRIERADNNFIKNEKFQREIWVKLKEEFKNEQDIMQLYELFKKKDKKILPKQLFLFSPLSIAPVQLEAFRLLSESGCKVNIYINQISNAYIGDTKSRKSAAYLRKKALEQNNLINEDYLNFYDIGNKLIANMGKAAQILYEQIDWNNLSGENDFTLKSTLLGEIQNNIFNDNNFNNGRYALKDTDDSVKMSSCFSPLREAEVLSDYLLDLFNKNRHITPEDIAVVSPDITKYAGAIDSVFKRCKLPYAIADRDINLYDNTVQLLSSLFSILGSRYEAPDVFALFEYSRYAQELELNPNDSELLFKWINENAVRYGLDNKKNAPDYSFKTGFKQLAAGFFMISEDGFSEKNDYCYPDIEGSQAHILGDFICFTESLKELEAQCREPKSIENWDGCFKECFKSFFGTDDTENNEDNLNPYQKVINAWDSLKSEMIIGFGNKENELIDFSVIKTALPLKLEDNSRSSYYLNGRITCSSIDTIRAVPHKVICCIGMNCRDFPKQNRPREISLMADYIRGDKNTASEDRLMFLEIIVNAVEKLYISWTGQDEKTKDELEPSSCVVMLIKNLQEQYGINLNQIITKHPLQPFSQKYFSGQLETYDNRWIKPDKHETSVFYGSNIWGWQAVPEKKEDKNRSVDFILKCFGDAPKYFLNEICNIYLPEYRSLLNNTEPLVVEKGLDEWILADLILKNDNYYKEIDILKLRGALPSGKFANEQINRIINDTEELKKKAESEGGKYYWIYPGKDKGKYRLRHWLYHLDLNAKIKICENTKMILKDAVIELKGMSKEEAETILNKIYKLTDKLEEKLLPIFPDAAWEYVKEPDKSTAIEKANTKLFDDNGYSYPEINDSDYKKIVLRNAETLCDISDKIEDEFVECSEVLFSGYFEKVIYK